MGEEIEGGSSWPSEEIEGGHLEGEEIGRGYTKWPKATHRGRRPPACEPSLEG